MRRTLTTWEPLGAGLPTREQIAPRAAFIRQKSNGHREPLRFTLAGGNRREGIVQAIETDGVRVRGELLDWTQIVGVELASLPVEPTPEPTVLACPKCGNEGVAENDTLQAYAKGCWIVGDDGKPEFSPSGDTDVCWDTQGIVEESPCFCPECCWDGKPDALVPVVDEDEKREKIADELVAVGWPAVAEDVRDGVSLEHVYLRLVEIGEGRSTAAEIVGAAVIP